MDFLSPSTLPRIPTYRVMSDDGTMEDPNREEPDVTDEQVLTWYKNMLTGMSFAPGWSTMGATINMFRTVNIMDSIMFEAQRQGRLSFYMVSKTNTILS
jgi:2-oxoisovalerate dehydrogenase E1 component alpha subunit